MSRTSIIATACEIGLEDLSMSKVADRLGVATQSLYRHVASREELVNLTVNHLVTEWGPVRDTGQPLEDWLYELGECTRELLLDHPGLAQEMQAIGPGTPEIVRVTERNMQTLVERGISPMVAFLLVGSVAEVTIASVIRQQRFATTPDMRAATIRSHHEAIVEIDPQEIPNIASIAEVIVNGDPAEYYEFITKSLIDGMIRRLITEG